MNDAEKIEALRNAVSKSIPWLNKALEKDVNSSCLIPKGLPDAIKQCSAALRTSHVSTAVKNDTLNPNRYSTMPSKEDIIEGGPYNYDRMARSNGDFRTYKNGVCVCAKDTQEQARDAAYELTQNDKKRRAAFRDCNYNATN